MLKSRTYTALQNIPRMHTEQMLGQQSMPPSIAAFSKAFEDAFRKETTGSPFTEVKQFQAMMRAFASLRPQYYLEEFHGFKRQVYFDTTHSWMRPRARCELCDVLIVTYATNNGFSARMTLLQAKLSRSSHNTGLASHLGKVEPQLFSGNYEQWDLLCRRPVLDPTTVFVPPSELLSSAVLPSVGTFGIFFRNNSGIVDLFYASADCVDIQAAPTGPDARLGKLKTVAGPATRKIAGWEEATYCSSAARFAAALFRLEIGTPILYVSPSGERTEYPLQLDWVRRVVSTHVAASEGNTVVTRDLLMGLGADAPLLNDGHVPSLLVLQGEQVPNEVSRKDR